MSQLPVRFQCRHILAAGHRCGSPALQGQSFCFYHHESRARETRRLQLAIEPSTLPPRFDVPLPEDRAAITLAIGEILQRLANRQLDTKCAGLLLYGLQIAAQVLPPPADMDQPTRVVEEVTQNPAEGTLAPVTVMKPIKETLAEKWDREDEEDRLAGRPIASDEFDEEDQQEDDELDELDELDDLDDLDELDEDDEDDEEDELAEEDELTEEEDDSPEDDEQDQKHQPPAPTHPLPSLQASATGPAGIPVCDLRVPSPPLRSVLPVWQHPDAEKPSPKTGLFQYYAGDHLISHTLTRAVPSAQRGLTSVFGMGTGVTLAVNSPANCRRLALAILHN